MFYMFDTRWDDTRQFKYYLCAIDYANVINVINDKCATLINVNRHNMLYFLSWFMWSSIREAICDESVYFESVFLISRIIS